MCEARKKDGSPCTLPPVEGDRFCWVHSAKTEEARRKGAAKGGRSRVIADLARLNKNLEQLGDDVMSGKADPRFVAVATNTYIGSAKVLETQAKWKELEEACLVETALKKWEVEELVPRLEAIEEQQEAQRQAERGNRWGA